MSAPLLATKLHIPPVRQGLVAREDLVERLQEGFKAGHRASVVSAAAGFGKTTLLGEWIQNITHPAAWLALDEADSDPTRFLTYLTASLKTLQPDLGTGVLTAVQAPQHSPFEALLTTLINEIAALPERMILVLDDYHTIQSPDVDSLLAFLVEQLPPQLHLVLASREDPPLPMARLRAHGWVTEIRAADLRFSSEEAAVFLNQVMGLNLSVEEAAALTARTEGWAAGLQLAALSLQRVDNPAEVIDSFTGGHRFVLDYFLEEVINHQPDDIQDFLLWTSILERMSGPLCDAVLCIPSGSGQRIIEYLERSNLFVTALDGERRWYRYHHLFSDLLRKRLGAPDELSQYHTRASEWYEENDLFSDAFHHAAAANDIDRAEELLKSDRLGFHFRTMALSVLNWLGSLPENVLDVRPQLRVRSATLSLLAGKTQGVEEQLQAAEKVLQHHAPGEKVNDLLGQIACARATLALTRYDPGEMMIQAEKALGYLDPDNLPFMFTANWALASASLLKGDRQTSAHATYKCIDISEKSGDVFSSILAMSDLGALQEMDNELQNAAGTYRQVLDLAGDHPHPNIGEVHLGLARICYQWNDLAKAEEHAAESLQLMRKYDSSIDRFILSEVFLARLKRVRGDIEGAASMLEQTWQAARRDGFTLRMPDIAAARVQVFIQQGRLQAADELARTFDLAPAAARVLLAQGDPGSAVPIITSYRQQMEEKGWTDEILRAVVLQAAALYQSGAEEDALEALAKALEMAESGRFIRLFVDEGAFMRDLLLRCLSDSERHPAALADYARIIVEAFPKAAGEKTDELLTAREMEILRLVAEGLTNREIGEKLYLAVDTVKGHNRRIFRRLQVQRRTEAVARARELGML